MRLPDAGDAVGNGDARQAVQRSNAIFPMLVTLSGMVMLVRPVQSTNALIPDAGDAVGNVMLVRLCSRECGFPDAGDAAPVDSSWNLNRSSGSFGIIGNRHRRVVGIDRISIQARYCRTRVA